MPNPMQRQNDRDGLQAYLAKVATVRRLVELGEIDPSLPTSHGSGSEGKMILLTIRDEMGLPMHVEGDSQECQCTPPLRAPQLHGSSMASRVPFPPIRRLMVKTPRISNLRVA